MDAECGYRSGAGEACDGVRLCARAPGALRRSTGRRLGERSRPWSMRGAARYCLRSTRRGSGAASCGPNDRTWARKGGRCMPWRTTSLVSEWCCSEVPLRPISSWATPGSLRSSRHPHKSGRAAIAHHPTVLRDSCCAQWFQDLGQQLEAPSRRLPVDIRATCADRTVSPWVARRMPSRVF